MPFMLAPRWCCFGSPWAATLQRMKPKNTPPASESTVGNSHAIAALAGPDQKYLDAREKIIREGRETFLEVGKALVEIRDYNSGVLFKDRYGNFEDYCRERWDFGRSYAYRLMGAAEIVGELSPIGDNSIPMPKTEGQIRPLRLLKEPKDRGKAWLEVVRSSGTAEITAKQVSKVVRKLIQGGATRRREGKTLRKKAEGLKLDPKTLKAIRSKLHALKEAIDGNEDAAKVVAEIEALLS